MPHIFQVKCYSEHHAKSKAKVGDVVYAKSNTDLPMHIVFTDPHCNYTAGKKPIVKARYMKPDGVYEIAEFRADELTL